jgi:hypothetical protein
MTVREYVDPWFELVHEEPDGEASGMHYSVFIDVRVERVG